MLKSNACKQISEHLILFIFHYIYLRIIRALAFLATTLNGFSVKYNKIYKNLVKTIENSFKI